MIRALYSAASGMTAQQSNLDNIANNLANSNTNGYKTRQAQFQDLLYQNTTQPGSAAAQQTVYPSGLQVGLGTRQATNEVIFTQGSLQQTQNPLDLAIQGNGFFQILQPSGTLAYTRDGSFHLDRSGNVVNNDGNSLVPQITVPPNAQNISIAADGTVSFSTPGQTASQVAGQIQLALFPNPGGLNAVGHNMYTPTDASGDPTIASAGGPEGLGTLLQGYVEQSNVSVVTEFINMIVAQRSYEANSKVIKAADEMYQDVNNLTQ
jgi:flagellar basal-body rod protein FlgG